MDQDFRDTLDIAMLHEKYGLKKDADEFRVSAKDLQKLIDRQRNNLELKDEQRLTLDALAEPIDTKSGLIWKDRSFKKLERERNENKLQGRIGNVAFDNEIQHMMEERFNKNLQARKRFVIDNALRAQASLDIVNDLYKSGNDSEAASGVTPARRAAIEMMNKTNNSLHKKSLSQMPQTVRDFLNDGKSTVSAKKSDVSSRHRQLQIKGVQGLNSPRERFNEDTNEEAK